MLQNMPFCTTMQGIGGQGKPGAGYLCTLDVQTFPLDRPHHRFEEKL